MKIKELLDKYVPNMSDNDQADLAFAAGVCVASRLGTEEILILKNKYGEKGLRFLLAVHEDVVDELVIEQLKSNQGHLN